MRPETAYRIVNREMRKFYHDRGCYLPNLSVLQCFKKKRVYQALKQLSERTERDELKLWEKAGFKHDGSIRAAYEDCVETKDILGQFYYISDRWFCAGRIKFILKIIDNLE